MNWIKQLIKVLKSTFKKIINLKSPSEQTKMYKVNYFTQYVENLIILIFTLDFIKNEFRDIYPKNEKIIRDKNE